jgi:hypothetical protein
MQQFLQLFYGVIVQCNIKTFTVFAILQAKNMKLACQDMIPEAEIFFNNIDP